MDHSFADDIGFGYDQISVSLSEFNYNTEGLDANSFNKISTVREREDRILKKLNVLQPPCINGNTRQSNGVCNPDLSSVDGVRRVQHRRDVKNNIENYFHTAGNYLDKQLVYENNEPPIHTLIQNNKKEPVGNIESFSNSIINNVDLLQKELDDVMHRNDMLTIFIYVLLLVVIITILRDNSSRNSLKYLMMRNNNQPNAMAQQ
jgi:hypothetical protein